MSGCALSSAPTVARRDIPQTPAPTPTPTPSGAFISIEPVTEEGLLNRDSLTAAYSLSVPRISDRRADEINASYIETLRYYKEDYLPMMIEDGAYMRDESGEAPALELACDYKIEYNDGETVSILMREGVLMGDFYSEYYYALTYSFAEGREVTLDDVIDTEYSAYAVAAEEIARQIDEQRSRDNPWGFYDDVDANAVAMVLTDTSFYLNENGRVVLILNPAFISVCMSGVCEFPL